MSALPFAIACVAGVVLGALYLLALRANTRQYTTGGPLARAVLAHLFRLVALAAAYVAAARLGASVLLGTFAGFLAVRYALVRRWGASGGH